MEAIRETPGSPFGGLALATVEATDGAAVQVRGQSFGRAPARLALPGGSYRPQAGDSVLVGRADDGGLYVVGVVRALRDVESLRASDGTTVTIEDDDGQEVMRVRDPEGRLMVEHRPGDGKTVIHAAGDLVLRAGGDLNLAAVGAIRVRAGTDLDLEGRGDVRLASTDLEGDEASSLTMREGRTQLRTRHLGAELDRADLVLGEANLVVGTMRSVARRVKLEVGLLETRAERIVEKARETWRETEGLSQTRAGRIRLVATGAFQAIGEQALLKARGDVKIKGEKIYLA